MFYEGVSLSDLRMLQAIQAAVDGIGNNT